MAQAARLNLRMQKELKLLLTDPPPGASFPHLDLSTPLSLTAIDALIDGPEGTVYEKGVFKIKIQIPERYPFQPPIVTFSTPIYHPNIDTGGRICLDILNLPPKGAWQPSLNISTVLTSIGLLLSEPNPDDGLMCEASREYKYNKQVFDQKARSMTEKYAKSDASPSHGGHPFVADSTVTEDKAPEPVKSDMHEHSVGFRKISGIGRKLSLDASGSNTKESDVGMNDARSNAIPDHGRCQLITDSSMTEDKAPELANIDMHKDIFSYKKLSGVGRKLSLDASGSKARESDTGINKVPLNNFSCQSQIQETIRDSKELANIDMHKDVFCSKKIPGVGRKLSLDASGSKTRESDMGMNKVSLNNLSCRSQIQEPIRDSKDMSFEDIKSNVMTTVNSDHNKDTKPLAISSKKLCLFGKNLLHKVSDSTKKTDVVDQKAISMTLNDAKSDASPDCGGNQFLTDSSKTEDKPLELVKTDMHEYALGLKKLPGISRKLSLNALGSNTRESEMGMNGAPVRTVSSQSQIQEPKQDLKGKAFLHQLDQDKKAPAFSLKKLNLSDKNLQHEVLDSTKRSNDKMPPGPQKENVLLISEEKAHSYQEVHKESTEKSCFGNPKRKKLGLTGMKPSSGFLSLAQNKENNDKVHIGSGGNNISKVPQTNQCYKGKPGEKTATSTGLKLSRKPFQLLEEKHNTNMNLKVDSEIVNTSATKYHGQRSDEDILEQGMCDSEGVIVLDSEDSEEEKTVKSSSRRLIGRKRLLGKS